ncbi:hypothetical protein GCM10020221_30600 [Streptomyces thioluteus]|uniref:Uncharacterized protein n=1 Tax=Streptomyces thioluteus TaxID=66431 RepID=A0ABN3X1M9_STRTU
MTPGSGLIMMPPVSVCHQVSTTGVRFRADVLAVPDPCLGVDGLADGAEDAQAGEVVPGRDVVAHFMAARIAVGAV